MAFCLFLKRAISIFFAVAGFAACSTTSFAQGNPCNANSTALMIQHFQAGTLYLPAFAPQVQQQIMMQTGGTTRVHELAILGPLQNISPAGQQVLPNGVVCGFNTRFQTTSLYWQIGYGMDGLIYGVHYYPASSQGGTPGGNLPTPSGPTGGTTPGTTPPGAPPTSGSDQEACQMFPNLC